MKNIVLLCFLSMIPIFGYTQNITSEEIEKVYTEAVDTRFNGDLAKARYLLENLQNDGVENEFVFSLLMEIYEEYLTELIQERKIKILQIAYTGIRSNVAKIWDTYPDSLSIQNSGLKISWMMGDTDTALAMIDSILSKNPNHTFANYFSGLYRLSSQDQYMTAIPFFVKVANKPLEQSEDQCIFQSLIFLGDIYLKQHRYDKALSYYKRAYEIAEVPDLITKIVTLEAYHMNFSEALSLFELIPKDYIDQKIFNVYIAALLADNTQSSAEKLSFLLSQNPDKSYFTKALIQHKLGRTQRALFLLDKEKFLSEELPGSFYLLKLKLLAQIGKEDEMLSIESEMGKFLFYNKDFVSAKAYLEKIPQDMDQDGEISYILGSIAKDNNETYDAENYFRYSLTKKDTLKAHTGLIEIFIHEKKISQAQAYVKNIHEDENFNDDWWYFLMLANISMAEKKYDTAEEYIHLILKEFPDNIIFHNLLAVLYIDQEKYVAAEKQLKKTYEMDPEDITTLNNFAYLYSLTEQHLDEALEFALKIVQQEPDEIIYLDTLAWIFYKRNELELAAPLFKKIEQDIEKTSNKSQFGEIFGHLGAYYKKIGDIEKSEYFFQEGLKFDSDNDYLKKIMQN